MQVYHSMRSFNLYGLFVGNTRVFKCRMERFKMKILDYSNFVSVYVLGCLSTELTKKKKNISQSCV